jgi:multiple sugar transport system permease protein
MTAEAKPSDITLWRHRQQVIGRRIGHWLSVLILIGISIVILAPIVWTVSTSLRLPIESYTVPPEWIPRDLELDNYRQVFDRIPFGRMVLNSAIITTSIVLGQLFTASLAGYAFARLEFPGRNLLFWIILATMMIPLQATIIPVFILIRDLKLSNSLWALILPALPTAFGTFLLRQYFMTVPKEFEESALIEGASQWGIFFRIYLPLVRPGLAVLAVLAFNYHWNEFFRPLIFLNTQEKFPIPLGIFTLQGYMMTGSISVVLAGIVLSLIPVVIVYLVGQRYLIEGLMMGGLKG